MQNGTCSAEQNDMKQFKCSRTRLTTHQAHMHLFNFPRRGGCISRRGIRQRMVFYNDLIGLECLVPDPQTGNDQCRSFLAVPIMIDRRGAIDDLLQQMSTPALGSHPRSLAPNSATAVTFSFAC
eukprot:365353-Chlamydomonas_euryale.AAC.8